MSSTYSDIEVAIEQLVLRARRLTATLGNLRYVIANGDNEEVFYGCEDVAGLIGDVGEMKAAFTDFAASLQGGV